ncbi:MAG: hypothetical protein NUV46_02310, partial [Nanoarchaeota archaeon]|nr:hypothetical protein [Nanoarchaeota archaeon]
MNKKSLTKGLFFSLGLVLFLALIFSVTFVLAVSIPGSLTFEGNTTLNYDDDGDFTLNWSTTEDEAVNFSIYIKADGTLFTKVGNDSLSGYSFSNVTNANYSFTVEAENATGDLTNSSVDAVWMIVDNLDGATTVTLPEAGWKEGTLDVVANMSDTGSN